MKAVIMAGGEGSRLRPLTCDIPKPMARLLGRPVLEYILDLLNLHGYGEASLTVRYLPQKITGHFSQDGYRGIKLEFVEEDEPLGTAGSVKNACKDNDDEILVISGDAMCDFDLGALLKFHRETGADATLAVKRVDDPREYGLIVEEKGNITAFIEKPAFSQAVSDLANTGIYILSKSALRLIPRGENFDFAKDLFPLMLKNRMRLMCWDGKTYWCDIGDLETYIRCQQDMLNGLVNYEIHGQKDERGNIFAGKAPPRDCIKSAPVYVGKSAAVEEGAVIEAGSVIDDGCHIERSTRITGSVLLPNSYISRRARLTNALVCAGASVKPGAMLFEGSAVGAGAVVGEKAVINPGVKIWNKKMVSSGTTVTEHIKTGFTARDFFDDDGITGQIGVELTPEFLARLGAAVGSLREEARIAVGYSSHTSAEVLASALSSGIRSTGCSVMDFGGNFQAQFEFSMNFCALPLGIFIKGDNRAAIRMFSQGGMPAGRDVERSVEAILSRGEFTRRSWDSMGDKVDMPGFGALYRSHLLRFAPHGLSGMSVRLKSANPAVQKNLGDTLYKLGCGGDGGFALEVSAQGDKVRVFDKKTGYIPHHKIFAWCAMAWMKAGNDASVPFEAPRLLDACAEEYGVRLERYLSCPAGSGDVEARKLAQNQMWSRDALMQSIMFLNLVKRAGGLSELLDNLPDFDREVRTVNFGTNPAGMIRGLENRDRGSINEGVLLHAENGVALVKPLKRGSGIKIMAEAANAEIACEICDGVEKLLKRKIKLDTQP